jgi:hypothetical protein
VKKKKKTLVVTVATAVLIVLAAAGALFALNSVGGSHRTCGKVDPAQLRQAADPGYARYLEKLARCG